MKRNTAKEKKKENRKYPYKSRLPPNVNQTEKYIVLDENGKEIGRYRLRQTCRTVHGAKAKVIIDPDFQQGL